MAKNNVIREPELPGVAQLLIAVTFPGDGPPQVTLLPAFDAALQAA